MSMIHAFRTSAVIFIFAFLMTFSFAGVVQAQSATPTTGCPQTCPSGQSCYQVTTSAGQSSKRCLTSAEASALTTQTSPTAPSGGASSGTGTLVNPLKADSLEGLLALIVRAVVRIGTIILVLALIWVGFLFVAARGNEEKLRNARQAFFWTIIGGLILLGAEGLSRVIQSTASAL